MPIILKTNLSNDDKGKRRALKLLVALSEKYSSLYQIIIKDKLHILIVGSNEEHQLENIHAETQGIIDKHNLRDIDISDIKIFSSKENQFPTTSLEKLLENKIEEVASPRNFAAVYEIKKSLALRNNLIRNRYTAYFAQCERQRLSDELVRQTQAEQNALLLDSTFIPDPLNNTAEETNLHECLRILCESQQQSNESIAHSENEMYKNNMQHLQDSQTNEINKTYRNFFHIYDMLAEYNFSAQKVIASWQTIFLLSSHVNVTERDVFEEAPPQVSVSFSILYSPFSLFNTEILWADIDAFNESLFSDIPQISAINNELHDDDMGFTISIDSIPTFIKYNLSSYIAAALINAGLENCYKANEIIIYNPVNQVNIATPVEDDSEPGISIISEEVRLSQSLRFTNSPIAVSGNAHEKLVNEIKNLTYENSNFNSILQMVSEKKYDLALCEAYKFSHTFLAAEILLRYKKQLNINVNEAHTVQNETAVDRCRIIG